MDLEAEIKEFKILKEFSINEFNQNKVIYLEISHGKKVN